ncbi:MAG: hypothetical protein ACOZQL_12675 [Myxococcota bacterium]
MPGELLYRIIDEPKAGGLREWAVRPFWPWLALLLGGAWVGVPWFVFNAFALGSFTRRREVALAVTLPLATIGTFVAAMSVGEALDLGRAAVAYLVLPVLLVKLLIAYVLFNWQSRAAQLHEHFGQPLRQGAAVAVVAFLLRGRVLEGLPDLLKVGLL